MDICEFSAVGLVPDLLDNLTEVVTLLVTATKSF